MAKRMSGDGSGLSGNGLSNSKTGPGQDGFNHPSHVTTYDNGDKRSRPYVGQDKAGVGDPRGKGTNVVGDE